MRFNQSRAKEGALWGSIMNANNEAKLAIIEQINATITSTKDPAERTALVNLMLNPELDLEPEPTKTKFINYANIGHKYDSEDRITQRDEKLISTLMGC